ncbi:MAG: PRC-barrel domain-containing protein [Firmicutes bacterium]|nr:PRC-barrel domain-containing protein [Bacillota bacterium]
MKSSKQILGLPVLNIEEGKQIGEVKHLVLNPQRGTVDFLLVGDGTWYLGLKGLPFEDVLGIGEFALTVADRSSLSTVNECAGAVDLLEKDLRLPGIKVLSQKGRLVGAISEYYISEDTGEILGCQLVPANGEKPAGIILRDHILTYGRDYLVIKENVEDVLVTELMEKDAARTGDLKSKAKAAPAPTPAPGAAPQADAGEKQSGDALKLFEERQKQYLLGKKVSMQIVADDGEVIAEEGEVITAETIERARAANRYTQLTLNISE